MGIYKEYRKARRQAFFERINVFKKIKKNFDIYKKAKSSPDPIKFSISENIAFVIDDQVVDIIHCQPRMASILLSNPEIVKIPNGEKPSPGWLYIGGEFIDPNSSPSKTYPHEKV
jgi:hypothetical protein